MIACACLAAAAAIWLPTVHRLFRPDPRELVRDEGLSPMASQLARRHMAVWQTPALRRREVALAHASNPEWDFMARSFFVWALGNMTLREPSRAEEYLAIMDSVIEDTIRTEREGGLYHFLMPYARRAAFVQQPARSLFLDGEIALMLAVRRLVREHPPYKPLLAERVRQMVERMSGTPVMSCESYPDECWMFCNTIALAAIRIADHLDGTDHGEFLRRWVRTARARLVDPDTGLLISSYTMDGRRMDGPEGSSIWMVAHCLQLVDESFARDQYERAKRYLARSALGFGYSREWPRRAAGPVDVDSGTVLPILAISPGASGNAFIAAAAFEDRELLCSLATTLKLAGFGVEQDGGLRHLAGNRVGDSVLLYSTVVGPVWRKVLEGRSP